MHGCLPVISMGTTKQLCRQAGPGRAAACHQLPLQLSSNLRTELSHGIVSDPEDQLFATWTVSKCWPPAVDNGLVSSSEPRSFAQLVGMAWDCCMVIKLWNEKVQTRKPQSKIIGDRAFKFQKSRIEDRRVQSFETRCSQSETGPAQDVTRNHPA